MQLVGILEKRKVKLAKHAMQISAQQAVTPRTF
jgi:hypothetical protein